MGIRKARIVGIRRVWLVVHNGDSAFAVGQWDRLIMAQAHRDGLMYQYAKYLMTEESDQWTNELSGGTQKGRR
jgi:hypothetical protein